MIAQASDIEGTFSISAISPGLKGDTATIMTSDEYQTIDMDKVVYGSTSSLSLESKSVKRSELYFDTNKNRKEN